MKEIIKAFFKSGGGSAVTIIFGIIITKLIAYYSGPTGVGLFSLLRQINQTTITIGTLSGANAIVQGLSSLNERHAIIRYKNTIGTFLFIFSIFLGTLILILSPQICKIIFDSPTHTTITIMKFLVIPSILGIGTTFFCAILNANRAIGRQALVQVFSSGATSFLAYPLIKTLNYPWSLLAILFSISFTGFLSAYLFSKNKDLNNNTTKWRPDWDHTAIRHFISYAGTSSIAGIFGMLAVLIIRAFLVKSMGLKEAGMFDVAWTLSNTYIMLVLSSLGMYCLPTLASKQNKADASILINQVLLIILTLVTPIILCVATLKPLVIELFYTKEFTPSLKIIRWMLIGDYFKAASWVLAMPMLAYGDLKRFLVSEVLANSFFFFCASISIIYFRSTELVGFSFFIMYVLYFLYSTYYFQKTFGQKIKRIMIYIFFLGILFLGIASSINWNLNTINKNYILISASFLFLFILLVLKITKVSSKTESLSFLKTFKI